MLSNSVDADTTDALRLQRLRLLGVIGARADLIATLAWGEAA
jgi:ethanolamine utilization microcompartment shell protein EutL